MVYPHHFIYSYAILAINYKLSIETRPYILFRASPRGDSIYLVVMVNWEYYSVPSFVKV